MLDFRIVSHKFDLSFNPNFCLFTFFFYKEELPKYRIIPGPKIYMRKDITKFLKGKASSYTQGDRIFAYEKRKTIKIDQIKKLKKKDFEKLLGKKINFISDVKLRE